MDSDLLAALGTRIDSHGFGQYGLDPMFRQINIFTKSSMEMRDLLDQEDEINIIYALTFFNNFLSLGTDSSIPRRLCDLDIQQRVIELLIESENSTILILSLKILTALADQKYLKIDGSEYDNFIQRMQALLSINEYEVIFNTIEFLSSMLSDNVKLANLLFKNNIVDETALLFTVEDCDCIGLTIELAKFSERLISNNFDDCYFESFLSLFNSILTCEYPETITYILKVVIHLMDHKYYVGFEERSVEYFTKALSGVESCKLLLKLLSREDCKSFLKKMWTPNFQQLLAGCVFNGEADLPENVFLFLMRITEFWRPRSDDLFVTGALIVMARGSFLQKMSAALYLERLFGYGDLDFVIDVAFLDLFTPICGLISDGNDKLLNISLDIASMVAISCAKTGQSLEEVPGVDIVRKAIKALDMDDLDETQEEKLKIFWEYYEEKEEEEEGNDK